MAEVSFTYFEAGERALRAGAEMRLMLQQAGDRVAQAARDTAPRGHPSHGGADSIHCETALGPTGWEAEISFDRAHYYLGFHEVGTEHMPARPFLRPALERGRL
jgi:HK97 gp10 family phage protein